MTITTTKQQQQQQQQQQPKQQQQQQTQQRRYLLGSELNFTVPNSLRQSLCSLFQSHKHFVQRRLDRLSLFVCKKKKKARRRSSAPSIAKVITRQKKQKKTKKKGRNRRQDCYFAGFSKKNDCNHAPLHIVG